MYLLKKKIIRKVREKPIQILQSDIKAKNGARIGMRILNTQNTEQHGQRKECQAEPYATAYPKNDLAHTVEDPNKIQTLRWHTYSPAREQAGTAWSVKGGRSKVGISVGPKNFSLLKNVQTDWVTHPASYAMNTGLLAR